MAQRIRALSLKNSRTVLAAALLLASLALTLLTGAAGPDATANAGLPQLVVAGATVRLDGSLSTSSTGSPLSYQWTFSAVPDGSAAVLSDSAAVNPAFVADLPGDYVVQLEVSDGSTSSTSQVAISTVETPPIADAGPNQVVAIGSVVHLDGSRSADPDGDSLTFQWNFVSIPANSRASIANPTAIAPTMMADVAGTYVAQLTVTDSHGNDASAMVTISTQDAPPLANAGPAQLVTVGNTVQLDGSASSDPGGDTLSFAWSLLSLPSDSTASLDSASTAKPTFTADVAGVYVAQLAVTDSHGNQSLATVEITTENSPPVAEAGDAQSASVGSTVQLDGRRSISPSGAPLQYKWDLLSKPGASAATVGGGGSSPTAFFTADLAGQYLVQLQVSDGALTSAPSTVLITAGSPGPNLVISPAAVKFGNQAVNTTSNPIGVTITNLGTTTLQVKSFVVSGANASEFAIRGLNSTSLAPNTALIFSVFFTPRAEGARTASLLIYDSTGGVPHVVPISGTGGSGPIFNASPSPLAFGSQTIQTTSPVKSLTVTNPGNSALQITGLSVTGINAADFSFAPGFVVPSPTTPISIAAVSGSAAIPMIFQPGATGSRTAVIVVTDNASGSPHSIQVTGTGAPAQSPITVSPASLTFPVQAVGSTSAALNLTVTNSGSSSAQITTLTFGGANGTDFSTTTALPLMVPGNGGTAVIAVTCTPAANGLRSGNLTVTDSTGGAPNVITLSGWGAAPGGISFTPSPLDFHNQGLNTTAMLPITVSNNGASPITVKGLLLAGTNAAEFNINGSRSFKVAPGATGVINVQFTPKAEGTRKASLIVYDDAPESPQAVTLTGVGSTLAPKFQVSPGSLGFPDQVVGTSSAALPLTVTNTGSAALQITGITFGGINPLDFGVPATFSPPTPAAPITVAANGGTAAIPLIFKPGSSGSRAATVIFTDNAGDSPQTVSLRGLGTTTPPGPISVTPSLNFPDQVVGTSSAAAMVTVANSGATAVQVTALSFGGANGTDFSTPALLSLTVSSNGGTATIPVVFNPAAAGSRAGTLSVVIDNNGATPYMVALSGKGTAAAPGISFSPTPLSFPDQGVKTMAMKAVAVSNTGGASVSVTGMLLAGTNASDFSINGPRSFTLAPGVDGAINVQFTPQAEGSRSALLIVYDSTPNSPEVVQLSGNGVVAVPQIGFNPSPFSFEAGQQVGTTSAPQSVTVSNSGTAPLQITSLSLSGSNAGDFRFAAGFSPPTPSLPITVANGGSATIPLIFKPTASGTRNATLIVADNASGSPHSLAVSGTGTAPQAVPAPSTLNFGDQSTGATSAAQPVTVTNPGTAPLQITNIAFNGANAGDFGFAASFTAPTPAAPLTVPPAGGSAMVPVVFTPTANGARAATLVFTDNAANSPQSAALSGNGVGPCIAFNPPTLNFGQQRKGVASSPMPASINNCGNADLLVTGISIGGTNASDFSFAAGFTPPTPGAPATVPAGGNLGFSVVFTPGDSTHRTGSVNVTDNAPGGSHALALSGDGTDPKVSLSAVTIAFPDQGTSLTSSPKSVTLTNTGTAPLTITSFSFTGANATDFATTTAPATVAANGTLSIAVTFTPSAIGNRSATLQINDDAAGSPQPVALSGKGVGVPIFKVDPASLDFGQQQDLEQSAAKTLTISNTGTGDLVINSMTIAGANGADFSYGIAGGGGGGFGDFPETIVPGANITVNVYFKPLQGGARSASLVISDNATGSPHTVPVSGTGIATPALPVLSPTALAFDPQPVNTTSAPKTFTITNQGQTDLHVTSVSLTGANASDFHVTPAGPFTVTKNNGTTTVSVTFNPAGLNGRSATVRITDDATGSPRTLDLSGTGRGQGQITLPPLSLGGNLESLATGSLDVAPTTDLPVTITSSDPTKVVLVPYSTDPTGATQGVAQITGTVPAGQGRLGFGFPGFWVQALSSSGTAQITIAAAGYVSGSATVTLTPSGFVLSGPGGTGANFNAILGADSSLTVSAVQLDTSGNILSTSQGLRGGSLANVTVNSSNTATGTIVGNPAVVQPGKTVSNPVAFHPVAGGTSTLSVSQPSGFSAPASGTSMIATVAQPAISLNPITVGYNLQALGVGQLNLASSNPLTVTITSSDPGRVLLSANAGSVGSGSIALSVPAGSRSLPLFYVQGLASTGVVTLTASASGYSTATGSVALNPSAFLLSGPSGMANFSTTTISPPTSLVLSVYQLDPSTHPMRLGQLRPGASASVIVTSGNTNTGSVSGSPALFSAGDTTNSSLDFLPAPNCTTPCTTLLSVTQPSGFSPPASGGQLTVTVNKPALSVRMIETTVGGNLEVPAAGALDAPAPNNLQVTIASDNPNLLLATSPTAVGGSSIMVIVPTGSGVNSIGFPNYYVQALTNSGTAHLTATASGFSPGTITVTMAPAGFVVSGNNGVGGNFGASLNSGTASLTLSAVVLDPATLAPSQVAQQVRGGIAPAVSISSDSAAATVVGNPVVVSAGNATAIATLQLNTTGVANISVAAPAGFSTPTSGAGLSVTIVP